MRQHFIALAGSVLLAHSAIAQVDHRGAQSSVKDQGGRGTCTAFAVCAALETFPGVPDDLSEQFVYAIVKQAQTDVAAQLAEWHLPAQLDEGSTLVEHVPWFQTFGAPHESALPYHKQAWKAEPGSLLARFLELAHVQPTELEAVRDQYGKYRLGDDARALSRKQARDVAQLRRWLDAGIRAIPVSYDLHVPTWRAIKPGASLITAEQGDWHFKTPIGGTWMDREAAQRLAGERPLAQAVAEGDWEVGYPQTKEQDHGGHAVTICGYTADGFLIKNSWGTGWGEAGYATVAFDAHAILCKEGLYVPSVQLRHHNLDPFARSRQIRAADCRCKVQPQRDGSWLLSTWTMSGPDPDLEIARYTIERQDDAGQWQTAATVTGQCRELNDTAARTSGFAATLDAAAVTALQPAAKVRIRVAYGTLDGAYAEPDQANWLRRVTFAPFAPKLSAICEPPPTAK